MKAKKGLRFSGGIRRIGAPGRLYGGRESRKEHSQDPTHDRIADHNGTIASEGGRSHSLESLDHGAPDEGSQSSGEGTYQIVPCKDLRPLFVRNDLRDRCLFDGKKRSDLITTRTDDADRCGDQKEDEIPCQCEKETGKDHQEGAQDEHPPPANSVGRGRYPQGDDRIPEEGQREQEPYLRLLETSLCEIEHQDDREKSVGEKARDTGGKKTPAIGCQFVKDLKTGPFEGHGSKNVRRFVPTRVEDLVILNLSYSMAHSTIFWRILPPAHSPPSPDLGRMNPLTSRKIRVIKCVRGEIHMKQNITLSIEKNLIKKAKVLSAKKQTSISQILSQEMERIVRDSEHYERAKQRAIAHLRKGFHMGNNANISREQLHERKGLR